MSLTTIDAGMLRKLFLAGAKNLEANRGWIDELNVFPVPDGDTGTNMTMTILSAVNEVSQLANPNMETLCKAISKGSLRGARGNSGVILSQLLRGFTRSVQSQTELGIPEVAEGFDKAVETAYKAVMKPKEGTILTVARGMAEKAGKIVNDEQTPIEFMSKVLEHGEAVLAKTPDMLPVLKQAGVVDAGGQGLVLFLRGVLDCMEGKTPEIDTEVHSEPIPRKTGTELPMDPDEIKFGYCTEFIINLLKPVGKGELTEMKAYLDSKGDSIVMVADDEFIKIHVHTNEPGKVLTKALKLGELVRIKIDNMREEHRELIGLGGAALEGNPEVVAPAASERKDDALNKEETKAEPEKPEEPPKDFGFVTVAAGDGFKQIFEDLNADIVISGGQTMNPCTDDFLDAIEKINAKTIFVYPNNSNIIMAANQAAEMTEDKEIIVIPTKTVPQGITCMVSFDPGMSAEENAETMKEMIQYVKTASVTYAIRDTSIDEFTIHEGDIMVVGDKGILAVGKGITDVACEGVAKMIDDETGLISIYWGEGYSEEEAGKLAEKIREAGAKYCDIEINYGGQPVYYCVISAE